MQNLRQTVENMISSMGYTAGFTVLKCEEEYEPKFAPGCVCDEQLFLDCDAGDEFGWTNDTEEVLHVEFVYFTFGNGEVSEASYEDLSWIENNFDKIEVLCEQVMSGKFKLFNPYYNEEGDEDED